jgi:hypothetical protein
MIDETEYAGAILTDVDKPISRTVCHLLMRSAGGHVPRRGNKAVPA